MASHGLPTIEKFHTGYQMTTEPIKGIIVPLITPLKSGDQLDRPALRQLVRYCLDGGVHGLFPGGTSGYGPMLPIKAWSRLMETVLDEAGSPEVVLAGAIAPSTALVLELVRLLEKIGYRRFAVTQPFYLRPKSHKEFLRHFITIAEATAMEMVLYDIPPCTGSIIPDEIVLELSRRGIASDFKDSANDGSRFERLCLQGATTGLRMYMGMKPNFEWLKRIGTYGCVPVPANVFPSIFSKAWESKDNSTQADASEIWDCFVEGNDFISATVYALSQIGIGTGLGLTPYAEPDEKTKQSIRKIISVHQDLVP
jgi:4-hydroxy-tetrahydrodipicolinate synthase